MGLFSIVVRLLKLNSHCLALFGNTKLLAYTLPLLSGLTAGYESYMKQADSERYALFGRVYVLTERSTHG